MRAVDLYAFVLMENHIHLLCRAPRANLSRFMQRLLSSYALYWRYKRRPPGHLFQGRFGAKLVEDEVYQGNSRETGERTGLSLPIIPIT